MGVGVAAPPFDRRIRALQPLDNRRLEPLRRRAGPTQNVSGNSAAAHEGEKDVLFADPVVAEPARLAPRADALLAALFTLSADRHPRSFVPTCLEVRGLSSGRWRSIPPVSSPVSVSFAR